MNDFKSSERVEGNRLVLTFEGMIDEDASLPLIDTERHKKITINLRAVKTINSIGIREWLKWIRPLSESCEIVLDQCPKAMVYQFNLVNGFLPTNATISSFFVPYFCDKCDKDENVLFTIGKEILVSAGEVSLNLGPKAVGICAESNCEMEMSVSENSYFVCLSKNQSAK